jgi:hypothetical protein
MTAMCIIGRSGRGPIVNCHRGIFVGLLLVLEASDTQSMHFLQSVNQQNRPYVDRRSFHLIASALWNSLLHD